MRNLENYIHATIFDPVCSANDARIYLLPAFRIVLKEGCRIYTKLWSCNLFIYLLHLATCSLAHGHYPNIKQLCNQ